MGPVDGEASAVQLGHASPMERSRRSVWLPCPARGAAACGPGFGSTAATKEQLRATSGSDRLGDTRDLAIFMVVFASGGRRRSEVAALRFEQLEEEPPVPSIPPIQTPLPCRAIRLGPTKTTSADDEGKALLVGPPVAALKEWLERADIAKGPVFRAIDRWGAVEERALTPQSIKLIVKRRCVAAGLDASEFSAHVTRAGYLTEAGSDAAVAAPFRPAGGEILQRRRPGARGAGEARCLGTRRRNFRGRADSRWRCRRDHESGLIRLNPDFLTPEEG